MEKSVIRALNLRSAEIAKLARTLGKDIHNHCLGIMSAVILYRNVTPAVRFIQLLDECDKEGNSRAIVRSNAVAKWFETFAFVRFKTEDGRIVGGKLAAKTLDGMNETELDDNMRSAKSMPWNTLVKQEKFNPFDLEKALATLVKNAKTKRNERGPNGETNKVDPDLLAAIDAFAKEHNIAA